MYLVLEQSKSEVGVWSIKPGGRGGERDKLGDWDGHIYTTIYINKIDN